jgi:secernin
MPFFARSRKRVQTAVNAISALREAGAAAELSGAMDILRTHQSPAGVPASGTNADICMHAAGLVRRSQTCGSMVSLLKKDRSIHLLTGTSAPCLSVFKPVEVTGSNSFYVLHPDGHTVEESLWHRFEPVHRHALFSAEIRDRLRDSGKRAESKLLSSLEASCDDSGGQSCLKTAEGEIRRWSEKQIETFSRKPFQYPFSPYGWFWKRINRMDGFDPV